MIKHTTEDLYHAIDINNINGVRKILRESAILIDRTFQIDRNKIYEPPMNTLHRSIRSAVNNLSSSRFDVNLQIIELLFRSGAQCSSVPRHNTLNFGIYMVNKSMKSREHTLVAEKNALSVLEILIKNGAIPNNDTESSFEYNTFSAIMRTQNLMILRFVMDKNLSLRPNNASFGENASTFECALRASDSKGQYDFLRIAISHGAIPRSIDNIVISENCNAILWVCIVFGGNFFVQLFHKGLPWLMDKLCKNKMRTDEKIVEMFEIVVCASGFIKLSDNYFGQIRDEFYEFTSTRNRNQKRCVLLKRLFSDYDALWSGKYLEKYANVNQHHRVIELKHKLSAKTQKIRDQRNCRKTQIENVIPGLPICCTDMIHGYDDTFPRLDLIDWSKY
jgi:hypothetical protein